MPRPFPLSVNVIMKTRIQSVREGVVRVVGASHYLGSRPVAGLGWMVTFLAYSADFWC